ncbi:MAG: hypothetical protein GY800_09170 [Planctomycetes bacterium]|nr:hypothetical protein [Planctomycetota bacterium]
MARPKLNEHYAKQVVACCLNTDQKFAAHKYGITKQAVNNIFNNYWKLMFCGMDHAKLEGKTFYEKRWYYWEWVEMRYLRK